VRVLILSKALVNGVYQKKLEELAKLPGMELLAVVPPYWHEARVGVVQLERRFTEGYQLVVEPMWFNGRHHVHLYPGLLSHVRRFRPQVLHVDEEPYNLVTFHATLLGRAYGAQVVFFTWQNLLRRYPPPFSWFERVNYRLAAAAVAGSQAAATVLRRKGYRGPLAVIPQFGVDPELFRPLPVERSTVPTIGFVGRLVPEKGADLLLQALPRMRTRALVQIVGSGSERSRLELLATSLGVRNRVTFRGSVAPARMPQTLNQFDVLVVPSRTRRNWKEQFGRVIIEAMACGIPVIGSSSGEIPQVIGDAGLVFPEDDAQALASMLETLLQNSAYRQELGRRGRQRVLELFTQARVSERYYELYCSLGSAGQSFLAASGLRR
jgi:glycosyltransferase involved in cell wall biosynthesis